ncbi:MAG TPA: chemotaxis protein CheW [Bacillota bacterium]|nr:chemotaxis protein CheW [Bacillota bacterium]
MSVEVEANKKVIVFQLKNEEYAVPVEQVSFIERMEPITRVPRVASFVKGVINLRGVVTPIIDVRNRFGMPESEHTDATRIIIIQFDEMEVGLIVDAANDVIDIPINIIESAPEIVGSSNVDYIEGVAKLDDRLLLLLNIQKVLTPEDMNEIKQVES